MSLRAHKAQLSRPVSLLFLVVVWGVSLAGLSLGGERLSSTPWLVLGTYLFAFIPYFAIIYGLGGGAFWKGMNRRQLCALVVIAACVVRVAMVVSEPLLSDDVYRYVWDGRVALHGINPFRYAPDHEALSVLRDDYVWPLINHKEVPTIYPPVAQGVFELNAWLGGGVVGLKALFVLIEGVCLVMAWRVLRQWQASRAWLKRRGVQALCVYALNPVVCVELAWSGHLDVLAYGTLSLALMVWFWGVERVHGDKEGDRTYRAQIVAALLLGVSVAAKMLPLIALPLMIFSPIQHGTHWLKESAKRLSLVACVLGVVGVAYVPYVDVGGDLFKGFGTYASKWRANDGAFRAMSELSEESLRRYKSEDGEVKPKVYVRFEALDETFIKLGKTRMWEGKEIADTTFASDQIGQSVGKLGVVFVLGLVMLWLLIVTRSVMVGGAVLFGAFFFLSPTVYPWYVAWLVPLAAMQSGEGRRRALPWSLLVFSMTSLSAYVAWVSVKAGGEWHVPDWVVFVSALAVLFVAWFDVTATGVAVRSDAQSGA